MERHHRLAAGGLVGRHGERGVQRLGVGHLQARGGDRGAHPGQSGADLAQGDRHPLLGIQAPQRRQVVRTRRGARLHIGPVELGHVPAQRECRRDAGVGSGLGGWVLDGVLGRAQHRRQRI